LDTRPRNVADVCGIVPVNASLVACASWTYIPIAGNAGSLSQGEDSGDCCVPLTVTAAEQVVPPAVQPETATPFTLMLVTVEPEADAAMKVSGVPVLTDEEQVEPVQVMEPEPVPEVEVVMG